jgi:sec-independent protein translocase protein TatB
MDFLGVGPLEFLIIIVIALIVVGPERLPELAGSIGKTWRQLYNMSKVVTAQWQEEFNAAAQVEGGQDGLRKALTEPLTAARKDVERALAEPLASIRTDTEHALTGPITTPVEITHEPSSTSAPPSVVAAPPPADGQDAASSASSAGEVVPEVSQGNGDTTIASATAALEDGTLVGAMSDTFGNSIDTAAAEISAPVGKVDAVIPSTESLDGNSEHGKE